MRAGVPAAMLGSVRVIATWTGASGNELASSHRIRMASLLKFLYEVVWTEESIPQTRVNC